MSNNKNTVPTTGTCVSCGRSIPQKLGEVCEECLPEGKKRPEKVILWASRHPLGAEETALLLKESNRARVEAREILWPASGGECRNLLENLLQEGIMDLAGVFPSQVWEQYVWDAEGLPRLWAPVSEPVPAVDGVQRGFKFVRWARA